jgi:hypothetical protein
MEIGVRSNEVFGWLGPERGREFLAELLEKNPTAAAVAFGAAAEAFHLRPQFLKKQPLEKRAEWARRALSTSKAANTAEQVLAEYFLETHRPLVIELLDTLEVEHEDGELKASFPRCPEPDALKKAVKKFRKKKDADARELLLRAFAAQSGVDWPPLVEILQKG